MRGSLREARWAVVTAAACSSSCRANASALQAGSLSTATAKASSRIVQWYSLPPRRSRPSGGWSWARADSRGVGLRACAGGLGPWAGDDLALPRNAAAVLRGVAMHKRHLEEPAALAEAFASLPAQRMLRLTGQPLSWRAAAEPWAAAAWFPHLWGEFDLEGLAGESDAEGGKMDYDCCLGHLGSMGALAPDCNSAPRAID